MAEVPFKIKVTEILLVITALAVIALGALSYTMGIEPTAEVWLAVTALGVWICLLLWLIHMLIKMLLEAEVALEENLKVMDHE